MPEVDRFSSAIICDAALSKTFYGVILGCINNSLTHVVLLAKRKPHSGPVKNHLNLRHGSAIKLFNNHRPSASFAAGLPLPTRSCRMR